MKIFVLKAKVGMSVGIDKAVGPQGSWQRAAILFSEVDRFRGELNLQSVNKGVFRVMAIQLVSKHSNYTNSMSLSSKNATKHTNEL